MYLIAPFFPCGTLFGNHVINHEWVMYTYRTNWLRPNIAKPVVKHLN